MWRDLENGAKAPPAERAAEVTELLRRWSAGDEAAADQAVDLLYHDLHRVAAGCFRHERPGHTLQATALVHEAWLRLGDASGIEWRDRNHFLSVAARVMRRVLVDRARQRQAAKRDGGRPVPLPETLASPGATPDSDVLAVDEALGRLEQFDPEGARLVELRFFAGTTLEEAADVLDVSRRTAVRIWRRARAWLYRELAGVPEAAAVGGGE